MPDSGKVLRKYKKIESPLTDEGQSRIVSVIR